MFLEEIKNIHKARLRKYYLVPTYVLGSIFLNVHVMYWEHRQITCTLDWEQQTRCINICLDGRHPTDDPEDSGIQYIALFRLLTDL